MTVPRRIILSRKGFDGEAGKCPSPIYPDGTMLSIPIPEPEDPAHEIHALYSGLRRQGALEFPSSLIKPHGHEIDLTDREVHLDPDIRPELRPTSASEDCKNLLLFGQGDGAQTELSNNGVGEGDLFLFYGWFKDARQEGESVRFETRAGNRIVREAHVIWAWLQVEKSHLIQPEGDLPNELKCAGHHPHIEHRGDYNNNCIYQASPTLSFSGKIAGAGVFEKYHEALRLTSSDERRCSFWTLPVFFREAGLTHLGPNTIRGLHTWVWEIEGVSIRGRSASPGQEFVMKTDGVNAKIKREIETWLESIFKHAKKSN
jgi:Nucleotide modification associated domain 3